MRYISLTITLIIAGCAHASAVNEPKVEIAAKNHEDGSEANLPMPLYEPQHNWVIVKTHGVAENTVAVVTFSRQELAAHMRLAVIRANGMSLAEHALRIRSEVDGAKMATTGELAAPPNADLDGFRWQSRDNNPIEGSTYGTVLIRRIPGRTDIYALCEGWWPETSDEYLRAPLHAGCLSVRMPPWE